MDTNDVKAKLLSLRNFYLPRLEDAFVCPHCAFEGTYMDTHETPFKESDGQHYRSGMRFTCKRCDNIVLEVVNGIS